jgi:hypothetical protein
VLTIFIQAPPEVRGALVALQQLAITFGILVSYFIGYGTNYLGGGNEDIKGGAQHDASWLVPICIQLIPSTILAVGMIAFMPQSPRHLMNKGREEECLDTLARLRSCSKDDIRVRIEFLEIKALREFERQRSIELFPQYQDGSFKSNFMIGLNDYKSLFTNSSLRKRSMVAILTMVFQQWNGVNAILYYAVRDSKETYLLCDVLLISFAAFYFCWCWTQRWHRLAACHWCCWYSHVPGYNPCRSVRRSFWT